MILRPPRTWTFNLTVVLLLLVFVNNITHNFAKIIDTCTHSCPKTIEFEWSEAGWAPRCTKISIDCGTLCLSHWHIHQHTTISLVSLFFMLPPAYIHTNCRAFVRFFVFFCFSYYRRISLKKVASLWHTHKNTHSHTFLEYPFQSFGFLWVSFTHYLNATFLILVLVLFIGVWYLSM